MIKKWLIVISIISIIGIYICFFLPVHFYYDNYIGMVFSFSVTGTLLVMFTVADYKQANLYRFFLNKGSNKTPHWFGNWLLIGSFCMTLMGGISFLLFNKSENYLKENGVQATAVIVSKEEYKKLTGITRNDGEYGYMVGYKFVNRNGVEIVQKRFSHASYESIEIGKKVKIIYVPEYPEILEEYMESQ